MLILDGIEEEELEEGFLVVILLKFRLSSNKNIRSKEEVEREESRIGEDMFSEGSGEWNFCGLFKIFLGIKR